MTAKTAKKKKPVRRSPRCVVCMKNPRDAGHSKLCSECDLDYGVALHLGRGTVEWAAGRVREIMGGKLRKKG